MNMKSAPQAVSWKNSPVKTFFPEEFQRTSQSVDDTTGQHCQRSILLHEDDEIFSMLLSRASSSFFNDDNDHSRETGALDNGTDLAEAGVLKESIRCNNNTQYERVNIIEECSSSDILGESSAERSATTTLHEDFVELKNEKSNKLGDGEEAKHGDHDAECGGITSTNIELFDNTSTNHIHTKAAEYKRNPELMSIDYELLQYIDFLDGIEKEFPAVADVSNNVDFTSPNLLAESVMKKVYYVMSMLH